MARLIRISANGVIWVRSDYDEKMGIKSITEIIDVTGTPYFNDTLTVLDYNWFEIDEDFGAEETILVLDNAKVFFSGNEIEVVMNEQA